MADEAMQAEPGDEQEILQPETEIPVPIDSLQADGVRPSMGDTVTLRVEGEVTRIENDCAYIKPTAINDTDLEEILAEHGGGDEDAMMERMTKAADMGQMQGGYG